MRIYIKNKNGRTFVIPAPMSLVKFLMGMGDFGISISKKYVSTEQLKYYENFDFKELKKGMNVLKDYKGLILVEISTKDGDYIKIVV